MSVEAIPKHRFFSRKLALIRVFEGNHTRHRVHIGFLLFFHYMTESKKKVKILGQPKQKTYANYDALKQYPDYAQAYPQRSIRPAN